MRRPDLTTKRPWLARPSRLGDSGWEVVAPPKHGKEPALVGSMLSEEDARLVAAAHELFEALGNVLDVDQAWRKIRPSEVARARAAIAKAKGEGFDPVAEDEDHARHD